MADREKVIKGLECCKNTDMNFDCDTVCGDSHNKCPYREPENEAVGSCMNNLINDAIALLEAQEPIAPHDYDPVIYGHRYTCGNCHHSLWRNDNYCSQCGKAVKWE
jgi:hypothetical protein